MTNGPLDKRHFHEQLDALQNRLVEMSGQVEVLFDDSLQALLQRDAELAESVVARDREVDALEVEIDEGAIELLALHQPMAGDLRLIMTILKLSNDVERVADHGVNIAEGVARIADLPPLAEFREVEEMAGIARSMLSDALNAFVSRDTAAARAVCARDDLVDRLRDSLFRILLTHMMENPAHISRALELISISQNIERIADLSTNISEDVVFLVEGRMIKHLTESSEEPAGVEGETA